MVVNSRQEAPCLFIFASLGDETDNLRVNKPPFLLLTISALGCFACSAVVHSPIHQFTYPGSILLWKQLSAIVLNWGCFHPECLILFISYSYVLGTFAPFLFWAFAPPSLFWELCTPSLFWGHLCASLFSRCPCTPLFLGCQSGLPKLRCEHFMTL